MVKKDDWITWGIAGLAILGIGYFLLSQKAGAPIGQQGIAVGEPNPSAPKEGCGCGMEPQTHSTSTSDSFASSAIPSTG